MSFLPSTPQSQTQPSTSSLDSVPPKTSMSPVSRTLPTPAHSVSGVMAHPKDLLPGTIVSQESPQKRKRDADDLGDQAHKRPHGEPVDPPPARDSLHLMRLIRGETLELRKEAWNDTKVDTLSCRTEHPPITPDISEDLFEMYNLTGIAAEVARVKPNGDKNALRKTYKGHIKRLGIAGHFDTLRKEVDDPSGFMAMLGVPDHEWNVQWVNGRDIQDGLSGSTTALLNRALTMAKGPVPRHIWDTSVLGDLSAMFDTNKDKVPAARPGMLGVPSVAGTPPFNVLKTKALAPQDGAKKILESGDSSRLKKSVLKKRGLGDDAFDEAKEAVPRDGPGFVDGGDRGQKRRKKNLGAPQQQRDGSMRQAGYGSPAVGA